MRFLAFFSSILFVACSGAIESPTTDATNPPASNPTSDNPTEQTKTVSEIIGDRFGWLELSYRIAGGSRLASGCEEKAFAIIVDVLNQSFARYECKTSGITEVERRPVTWEELSSINQTLNDMRVLSSSTAAPDGPGWSLV